MFALPAPRFDSEHAIEKTLLQRRSIREYAPGPITLEALSQLLWAAQGITNPERGLRTAPSAGALFPLEVYAVVGEVMGLDAGVYKYHPHSHALMPLAAGDLRDSLAKAALDQEWVTSAAVDIVLAAIYRRTTWKYGERGIQYVHMEIGAVAQNVYLQGVALGLGTVFVGAFMNEQVQALMRMPAEEQPLCILPIGRPA